MGGLALGRLAGCALVCLSSQHVPFCGAASFFGAHGHAQRGHCAVRNARGVVDLAPGTFAWCRGRVGRRNNGTVLMAIPALDQGHSSALGIGLIIVALCSYGVASEYCAGAATEIRRHARDLARAGCRNGFDSSAGNYGFARGTLDGGSSAVALRSGSFRNSDRVRIDGGGGRAVWRVTRLRHNLSYPGGSAGFGSASAA